MLVWGADRFVIGAAGVARSFGVSPLLIGLTIVGFGTSAPEMLVSSLAAAGGEPGLSIGNAIGSNITNLALVLGVASLVTPLTVHQAVLRLDAPVLILVMFAGTGLMIDGELSRIDGAILLTGLFVMVGLIVRQGLKSGEAEGIDDIPEDMARKSAIGWLSIGLVILLGGAKLLVDNAVAIAVHFEIDSAVIGLTVVAFGTSLPELAATVVAARRNEHDIAVGNIIGSNMFNMLGVLGLPGLIHPNAVPEDVLLRDAPMMIGIALLFWVIAIAPPKGRITRAGALLLCLSFAGYIGWVGKDTLNDHREARAARDVAEELTGEALPASEE